MTLQNIEEDNVFLMVSGGVDLAVYKHGRKEVDVVEFGEEGSAYAGLNICKVQVALNNKFFMIGLVENSNSTSKRALGFFGLDRLRLTTKPLKWVTKVRNPAEPVTVPFCQYPFKNFYADDHLSTMMLIDDKQRTLDFHYILWRFDTSQLDLTTLKALDNGPGHN